MRKVKSFEEFNEEISWKTGLKTGLLAGGLMAGAGDVIGQEVDPNPIIGKFGVHAMDEEEGVLVKDRRIVDGFKMLLEDPRITVEKEYTLVNVYDLGDFDNYRLELKRKNARPGEAKYEVFVNKREFEDYISTGEDRGKISLGIYYQFIEDEELIPSELRGKPDNRKRPDDSQTFRL